MAGEFKARKIIADLASFEAGVNEGVAPLLLQRNQLAKALNVTVRGTFATHRPSLRKIALTFADTATRSAFETQRYQGGCHYAPDNADECLMASISGKLFKVIPAAGGDTATVSQVSSSTTNQTESDQAWLWQSEKWVIWNDGISNPVFYDNSTCVRSTYSQPVDHSTTVATTFVIPAFGATTTAFDLTSVANLNIGDTLKFANTGSFVVQTIAGVTVTLLNVDATPVGKGIYAGQNLYWSDIGAQLPPGRMGTYGMGRNWVCLPDGKQFVAGDIVGGASGTPANNFRDAVLEITENFFLAGGGNFTVPGSIGDIKAMKFVANLDTSLGQGPLQVLTPSTIFSVNTPVDRTTWQNLSNPILTESAIGSGGLSQNSTVNANSDLISRAPDGVRSLILARREFTSWGNTPTSQEVQPLLSTDNPSLLHYSSAIVFDNRLLMTTAPTPNVQGVFHEGLVIMNFDAVSSLRGKAPSIWEGAWTGIDVFQLIVGDFTNEKRAFAFTLNSIDKKIELYEILRDEVDHYDNYTTRIQWEIESPVVFDKNENPDRQLLQLRDGEVFVDNLKGTVDFDVYYKPDQWPCWVPWFSWQECAKEPDGTLDTVNRKPQFRPRMGLGEPSPIDCDETNNRPLREGFSFQVKFVITGTCRFLGARFEAITMPQPAFAKQSCDPIC